MTPHSNDINSDYRREALMWWLLVDEFGEHSETIQFLLKASDAMQFETLWDSLTALAVAQFGEPQACEQCGRELRFRRLASAFAEWECPECDSIVSVADGFQFSLGDVPHGGFALSGTDRDRRYDAICDWMTDPGLNEGEFATVSRCWFMDAPDFKELWEAFATGASECFPPPKACVRCAANRFSYWRPIGFGKGAIWCCETCGALFAIDAWDAAATLLGLAEQDLKTMRAEAAENGVTPVEFLAMSLREVNRQQASDRLPPPESCFKCGESLWEFESLSPNQKAAKWKCGYCGRIELVTVVKTPEPDERARTAIPKDVQREVWRRDGGKCQKCGSRENLEFDHIIAVALGGSNTVRNIQLLCSRCNGIKSDREPGAF